MNEKLRLLTCAGYLLSAIMDTLTGFLSGIPISLGYKAVVTVVACSTLAPKHLHLVLIVFVYYVTSVLYTSMFHSVAALDVIWAMRNLMLLAATLFFFELVTSGRRAYWERKITQLSIIALVVFTVNILLGATGIGATQYGSADGYSAGGKGFIVAGNELVTAMLAICGILTLRAGALKLQLRMVVYVAMTVILIISGTKSGILGLLFLIGIREGASADIGMARRGIMLAILLFAVWFSVDTLLNSFAGRRFVWFFETEGLARALLSNRDFWASQAVAEFLATANGLDYLLGIGAHTIANANNGKPIIEMDFVDFFITYGLIGVIVSHLIFIVAIRKTVLLHAPRTVPLASILLFAALSAFTGHVLNGGTSAPYLAAFLAMAALSQSPIVDQRVRHRRRLPESRL